MRHFALSPRDCAHHVLPETILHPCTVDDVLALPSFLASLLHAQTVIGCRIDELSHDIQAAIVERRLSQLVSIARINPLWRRRIDSAVGTGPVDNYEQFKALPTKRIV